MQFLLALPAIDGRDEPALDRSLLFRAVAGIPLVVRVLAVAGRAGAKSVVIVVPSSISEIVLRTRLEGAWPLRGMTFAFIRLETVFNPNDVGHWTHVEHWVDDRFGWLPWDFVTVRQALLPLVSAARGPGGFRLAPPTEGSGLSVDMPSGVHAPAVVVTRELLDDHGGHLEHYLGGPTVRAVPAGQPGGIRVSSSTQIPVAETLLIRGAGKVTDGRHSNCNRRLSRPVVRWLLGTPITANMISIAGLPIAALSAVAYGQGYWGAYVVGGLLYFAAVLVDEMDGMVARTKFQESAFGSHLEAFVDFVSYLFLWIGISVGLYRERGDVWLWVGGAVLFGTVMSYVMQVRQRRIAAPADRPQDHVKIVYEHFEADSRNPISWVSRTVHPFTKKGALCHYALWFSVLGLLPLFFTLSTIGSNCLWSFGFYANRFFRNS